jgi:hypothetical protein
LPGNVRAELRENVLVIVRERTSAPARPEPGRDRGRDDPAR